MSLPLRLCRLSCFICAVLSAAVPVRAESAGFFSAPGAWLAAQPGGVPFAFTYDGQPSASFLATWTHTSGQRELDAQRREHTQTFTDPKTGLEVRCVAVTYRDFPVVEWTVYFRNTGPADTPLLTGIHALNARWSAVTPAPYTLHTSLGALFPPSAADYTPVATTLNAGHFRRFFPVNGRPTCSVMPYFNIDPGDGTGLILAVGWPGAWVTEFTRDVEGNLRVTAGQEYTRMKLHPDEEIRTPLIALLAWRDGDWIDGQNLWRRWLLAHNLPRPGGKAPQPVLAGNTSAYLEEMVHADAKSQIYFTDRYLEEKIPIDFWWMDAGWYENTGIWQEATAWRTDRKRFPAGMREVTDHGHARGVKSIVWFEPERIMPAHELFKTHPEWLLANPTPGLRSRFFYLGNPEARAWLTDEVSKLITAEGIDVYRQDFNVLEPLSIWRHHDAPDRQGITENHHITGYLAFWDELLRRHPGLQIDSCAGGGTRNDLETMRRALPFWRSDYIYDIESNQNQTHGLALWLPYFGTAPGPRHFDRYALRSHFTSPLMILNWDMRDPGLPYDALRQTVREWRIAADNYNGDYYPLTASTLAREAWLAWQFNRPEAGRGVVQAFRRDHCTSASLRVQLRGLEADARYRVQDIDQPDAPRELPGRELMETGLEIVISSRPGAAILTYEKLTPGSP